MSSERLKQQIDFIVLMDKMKQITRQNYIIGGSRRETDAEHSWHLALMAVMLAEYVKEPVDVARVVKMVLLHDVVEIDAGDTYCFDDQGLKDKAEREECAAQAIFSRLPENQAAECHALWREFEARVTPEARFADALDRLQPLLLHANTEGKSWREHGIHKNKVVERNKHTREVAPELGELVAEIIENCVQKGYLPE